MCGSGDDVVDEAGDVAETTRHGVESRSVALAIRAKRLHDAANLLALGEREFGTLRDDGTLAVVGGDSDGSGGDDLHAYDYMVV